MNVLGLYTKQEAKEIRDIRSLNESYKLLQIAGWIKEVQQLGDGQTTVIVNMIVHDDVEKYFKNTVGYDTFHNRTGQPAGYTLLNSISWL